MELYWLLEESPLTIRVYDKGGVGEGVMLLREMQLSGGEEVLNLAGSSSYMPNTTVPPPPPLSLTLTPGRNYSLVMSLPVGLIKFHPYNASASGPMPGVDNGWWSTYPVEDRGVSFRSYRMAMMMPTAANMNGSALFDSDWTTFAKESFMNGSLNGAVYYNGDSSLQTTWAGLVSSLFPAGESIIGEVHAPTLLLSSTG
jgi:hypothetical protein